MFTWDDRPIELPEPIVVSRSVVSIDLRPKDLGLEIDQHSLERHIVVAFRWKDRAGLGDLITLEVASTAMAADVQKARDGFAAKVRRTCRP